MNLDAIVARLGELFRRNVAEIDDLLVVHLSILRDALRFRDSLSNLFFLVVFCIVSRLAVQEHEDLGMIKTFETSMIAFAAMFQFDEPGVKQFSL